MTQVDVLADETPAGGPIPKHPLSDSGQYFAIRTWRYLRLAMVAVVLGLFIAVWYEHEHAGCWQTSLSAYYYTPVRSFFVGALVAIGVCLFSLKGIPEAEDIALNLAGLCAPLVAFVPTPDADSCDSAGSDAHRADNVHNNVAAYLWMVAAALLVIGVVGGWKYWHRGQASAPSVIAFGGYVLAVAALLLAWFSFISSFPAFDRHAHDRAASAMFVLIWIVAVINAFYVAQKQRHEHPDHSLWRVTLLNPYTIVAVAMVASYVILELVDRGGWRHRTLAVEFSQILLFALFWLIQTIELWQQGLRRKVAPASLSRPPES